DLHRKIGRSGARASDVSYRPSIEDSALDCSSGVPGSQRSEASNRIGTASRAELLCRSMHEHAHGRCREPQLVSHHLVRVSERRVGQPLPLACAEVAVSPWQNLISVSDDEALAVSFELIEKRPARRAEPLPMPGGHRSIAAPGRAARSLE